jgi:hypothetical protein
VERAAEDNDDTPASSKIISHFQLQELIEEESRSRFGDNKVAHVSFTQGIAEVWQITSQSLMRAMASNN